MVRAEVAVEWVHSVRSDLLELARLFDSDVEFVLPLR